MFNFADVGGVCKHVTNDSSANSYVRYKDLNKNNLIKCISCCNYTDITCEQYDQDTLTAWLGLMSSSDDIGYICKFCKSTKEKIKSTNENIITLSSQLKMCFEINEQNIKNLDVYKRVIHDYEIKVSAIDKNLPALVEKVSKLGEKIGVGKHEKSIKDIAQVENSVLPIIHKEAVSLHPNKTKDSLPCPVNVVREKYLRRKRLVFIGVPKDIDDKTFIKELSEELNLGLEKSAIKKTFRIKARNIPVNKTPPLNIEFCDATDRSKILNQTTIDKIANLPPHSRFRNIKFFPDRSYKQRKKYKELKLQMDARNSSLPQNVKTLKWKIKNMSLIKVLDLGIGETTT